MNWNMSEIKKYNHLYELEKNGNSPVFSSSIIDVKPKTLFKYYSIDKYSVQNLLNNKFYCSSPSDFNDLFEFNQYLFDFSRFTSVEHVMKEFEWIIKKYESQGDLLGNNPSLDDVGNYLRPKLRQYFGSLFGLVCLSCNDENDLMWGYYGKNEGFQIEFDLEKIPFHFKGPYKVNYPKKVKPIDLNETPLIHAIFINLTNKKKLWNHEGEYRYIVFSSGGQMFNPDKFYSFTLSEEKKLLHKQRLEKYPVSAIKSITLGFNFLVEDFKINENKSIAVRESNKKSRLKVKLLDFIYSKKINLFMIDQDVSQFKLKKRRYGLKINEDGQYLIQPLF